MAKLRRDELRAKVKAYFAGQLEYYVDRLNYNDPTPETLADIEAEILDHADFLKKYTDHPLWLKVDNFKAHSGISDEDWPIANP